MYIQRHSEKILAELLQQFPAILLTGARQVGKSTLLQHLFPEYRYLSFDDPLLLEQAKNDPQLFFLNYAKQIIFDEVQYAPELFRFLKLEIDRQQKNGIFLLSGSQAFELAQNVSETLAGRIAIIKLKGLSLREIYQVPFYQPFVPNLQYISDREQHLRPYKDLWQHIHQGDMPRLYRQKVNWQIYYSSYVATYIERDVKQLTAVQESSQFTRFMTAIAVRSGELLNYSTVGQEAGVSADTVRRWLVVLQGAGIVYLLQPYSNNHLKRTLKTPKVYMLDTGLMAYLSRWLTPETIEHGAKNGQFFETFVVSQIVKSFTNNGIEPPPLFLS